MDMVEAFERVLKNFRYDRVTRLAYADWLEEHGYDDEAAEMRRRATPAWEEADRWMHDFADRCGGTCENYGEDWKRNLVTGRYEKTGVEIRWRKVTYGDVVEAGRQYVATCNDERGFWEGDVFIQSGSETARNLFEGDGGEETKTLFWKHWQTVTGISVGPERQGVPFSCSC